jgi:rhodanese-related sulfurtransferase
MSDLLAKIKSEITEVTAEDAAALENGSVFVDVREQNEWDTGYIPGAHHIPRANLEAEIERVVPDRATPVVLYCARGNRSAYAAKTLEGLGYEHASSLAGGIEDWKRLGLPLATDGALGQEQLRRYSRHLLIPEIGIEGQQKLLESRILLVGAGGLGSPASLYLAAAGVGTLGIVDADVVDETNLQRQIVHNTSRLGEPKVASAAETIRALNPDVDVRAFEERLTSENVDRILEED